MIYRESLLGDLLTPVSTFLLLAADAERAFLLESVEGAQRIGRYSFIGLDPQDSFQGSYADFRASFPDFKSSDEPLPPFCGGAVGWFAYDLVREFERLPGQERPTEYSAGSPVRMDFYSTVLVFDHLRHEVEILSWEGPAKVAELAARLRRSRPLELGHTLLNVEIAKESPRNEAPAPSRFGGRRFEEAVRSAQEYVREGDVFQVVLSQRFVQDFHGDPFNVYRALRYLNPSPYHFFLKQGDLSVAGASPEMLVRVQGKNLEVRPIAGTRRRGRDAADDLRLQEELLNDEKEKAEHLMLVDLGRNDLGRVSTYGSVSVEEFMRVERYSHVMHLVSSVKGEMRPGLTAFDVLPACFPAGTVSGAPKVRAMQIIDELEPARRGIYAGAIAYIDYSGNLDTCIAIRTIVFQDGKAYVQAGAGIVADSVPRHEDLECHNKARVLFQALEMGQANATLPASAVDERGHS